MVPRPAGRTTRRDPRATPDVATGEQRQASAVRPSARSGSRGSASEEPLDVPGFPGDLAAGAVRKAAEGLDGDRAAAPLAPPGGDRTPVGDDDRVKPPAATVDAPPVGRGCHEVAVLPPQQ